MTVINMISFGDEGAAVADEQSSGAVRKYNVAQKLQLLNDSYIYGGSGPSDDIKEIYNASSKALEEIKKDKYNSSLNNAYGLVQDVLINYKNDLKNRFLLCNIGISLKDFLTGTYKSSEQKLDGKIMEQAASLIHQADGDTAISLLLGGLQDKKFDIYELSSFYAGRNISRPYATIGSGKDESEKVLSGYVASLPREKRSAIDKREGLVKIIEATNASSNLNMGVGGSPSIVYITADSKIKRPNEKQCVLASELVEGLSNSLLPKDFVYDKVFELVCDNGDFKEIEEKMKEKSCDWNKLDRILRGYKE